jgi:peptide/nickel transport system substrate-binding protein
MLRSTLRAACVAASLVLPLVSQAQTAQQALRVGFGATVTALDPHYHNLTTNNMIATHVFDPLILQDEKQRLRPGLALSWKTIDETTWEFKLRPGVKFHDGSDFTAEDVIATIKRAPAVPNSPSSFRLYVAGIKEAIAVDPLTVRFVTGTPYPLLPNDLSAVLIVSKAALEATTADFNSGKAAIGTGPFKFREYVSGDHITFDRNDTYWGAKPEWSSVNFRIITNSAARVAALKAGDVDLIDNVPPADIAQLKNDPRLAVSSAVSNRLIFLGTDYTHKPSSPFVTNKDGKPLENDPLLDVRVRRAISLAINRQAIVDRVLEGQAVPAGQLLPDGFFGTSPKLPPSKQDLETAKKLLAEAGYPNGFQLTLLGPNDRYINDDEVLQAVAQSISRIGITSVVDAQPWTTFVQKAAKGEFGLHLAGWGAATGEVSSPLRALVATYDTVKSMGTSNRGRYSNPTLDKLIDDAVVTVDFQKREALLQQASEAAIGDFGVIPLHFEVSAWAFRKGLTYVGRADQYTLVTGLKTAN